MSPKISGTKDKSGWYIEIFISSSSDNQIDFGNLNSLYYVPHPFFQVLAEAFSTYQSGMTFPNIVTSPDWIDDIYEDLITCKARARKIIVANFLPLIQTKTEETGKWCFKWDEDSLLFQLREGFSPETEVIYVGSLKLDLEYSDEQKEVARTLFKDHKCIPTFLPSDIQKKFYYGFCKQQLWPLFHYMLPHSLNKDELVDPSLFKAYVTANSIFADRVKLAIRSNRDCVWVHDYHLMLLPTFLRKKVNQLKLGFFLHIPFPSSEIYRTLPARKEVLKGLLNVDLIGFHTYEYARHFLSCCKRMLGLEYACKRGYMELEYLGRTISIKILPVGIHIQRIHSVLNLPTTITKVQEIEEKFKGKNLILGVDDIDMFKGVSLKLEGFELLLERYPSLRGLVVLVQIFNPARSTGKDARETLAAALTIAKRINSTYGHQGYRPVILMDGPLHPHEKVAYYVAADCCIVNSFRDGMNLVPYEYVVCRQGTELINGGRGFEVTIPRTSTLIVSEFIGCSQSLSGAIRVNPWSVEDVSNAFFQSLHMNESEREMHHEKHYKYVSSHDVAHWSKSFLQDLDRACKNHADLRYWSLGLGLNFRLLARNSSFQRLSSDCICSSYQKSKRRVIFLDFDGTLVPANSISKIPSTELISILNRLCSEPKNTVFVVSGRSRTSLAEWFSPCETLGIAAEHGYFISWNKASNWESSTVNVDSEWRNIAEPIMEHYTEATDGSSIESKETALVWHYQYADLDFGVFQSNELFSHLESVLANDPVVVKRGEHIVEVKPHGVSKGMAVETLLSQLINKGMPPDFILCIGDDKSDEDMFESINKCTNSSKLFPESPQVFSCTIMPKPSKAMYYLTSTREVIELLEELAVVSSEGENVFA